MKLIKNLVCTKIDDHFLLINSLNGLMDIIDQGTLELLQKWSKLESIHADTLEENEIFQHLNSRGYFCTDHAQEQQQKDHIIQLLRDASQKKSNAIHGLTFVMTYDCNFRCPYCFEGVDDKARGIYINEAQIDAALKLAGDSLLHIGLFGGEPLLPRNRNIIKYLFQKAPDKSYDLITNGFYLDQYIDLLSKVTVTYVMITLDGKKSTHDKKRFLANGAPSYDKILENIQKALENRIPIRIRMNIDKETMGESLELRDMLLCQFKDYSDLLSFEISPLFEIKWPERNQMFSTLSKVDSTLGKPGEENVLLSRFSPVVNSVVNGKHLHPVYSYCLGHQSSYIVDPNGLIYACLVAVGKKEYAVGTYYPTVRFFENSVKCRNIETIKKCRDCAYSLLCGGGCPLKLDNPRDIYQPECGSIMNDIHVLVPQLLHK